jgi:alkanesulfonate monooxygenase SsuD/methylene tetrahydromethanopterin reductase-like flavin-dependent oxidoreductase (luciferase family)
MKKIEFGWVSPSIGIRQTGYVPLAMHQAEKILPSVVDHFDAIWTVDHLFGFDHAEVDVLESYASTADPETGKLITDHRADPYLEGWTILTWLAACIPKVMLGPLVLSVGYRSPALLAKMAASLQMLSEGRLILGLGAGWREEEYDAYGFTYHKASERIRQLEEALEIIRLMWTEHAPSYRGKYYEIENAYCEPHPDPPPPILIGGVGEQLMLPLIARHADWWNADNVSPGDYRRKRDILFENALAANRDPGLILQSFLIEEDAELPESRADSQRWIDRLSPLIDLGVSHFMIDFGYVHSEEHIHRFAEEVIAKVDTIGDSIG